MHPASAGPSFREAVSSLGGTGYEVLESVFEHAPFGVYIDHPTEGCTYASPFLLEQFGVKWPDFEGFGWARYVLGEDVERMQVAIQEYEHSREPINVSYRVRHADDSLRWVHARVRAVVDRNGDRVGSIGLTTDVTEQREFEQRVAATQKLEAVGSLSAHLAHDLNNLFTVILASKETLAPLRGVGPEHDRALEAIDLSCDQARQLTEQLLSLAGGRVRKHRASRLDDEIRRFSRLLEGTLGEGIEVDLDLDANEASVPLDRSALAQVVLNLATNGRDAMMGRGTLRIVSGEAGGQVTFAVQDSGSGMDAATVERAFEPFFTTKEEGRGTGLGLATVLDLVEVVGGSVRLDTAPGVGTSAVVTLPRVPGAAADSTQDEEAEPAGPLRILILEDNEAVRQSVAYALALVGHSVESAGSLREGRARLDTSEGFDLLVADILLPDGSGVDFYHEMASGGEVPVVFMSGFTGRDTDPIRKLTGAATFVAKPFRPREIVSAISRVMAMAGERSTHGVHAG